MVTFSPVSQVTRKLDIATPPPALVDAYLVEIAKGYGVDWSPSKPDEVDSNTQPDDGPEGGTKVCRRLFCYVVGPLT